MRPLVPRAAPALLLLGALTPLGACTTDVEPIPADGAVAHYEGVVDELEAALASSDTAWQHAPDTTKVVEQDGTCRLTPGTWQPESPLAEPEGDDGWQERIAQLNPVLAEHGFAEIDDVTAQGSRSILESRDTHGASLEITAEGRIRIWDAAVDADPCTPETLGIG